MTIEYTGSTKGSVRQHTEETLKATYEHAYTVLPNPGGAPIVGELSTLPQTDSLYPVVLFMHGSSGVNEQTRLLANWLADSLQVAMVVPDSMQTADRLTYSSPIPADDYEDIHAMRLEELKYAMQNIFDEEFCDGRVFIAGTSEGGVCVARYESDEEEWAEVGRMIFSWSCEDNYHVREHGTNIPDYLPVLNIMSAADKFFSQKNSYLDNPTALGHAGKALENNPNARILLLPGAPHTLFNLPVAREAIKNFIEDTLRL